MDLTGGISSAADGSGNATNSSTSIPCRDQVYSLEVAKRAVARAALHLGITSMTVEVLDTLGDVLCEYIQRLGGVLAHNVESSGRSTQHCNAMDMIRAVELCTSPAVNRVHFTSATTAAGIANGNAATTSDAAFNNSAAAHSSAPTTNHNNISHTQNHTTSISNREENGNTTDDRNRDSHSNVHAHDSWQGLAAFCFGPNWQDDKKESELEVADLQGAGGKVGPRAMSQQEEAEKDCQEGWRAPYPDEVLPFPLCSPRVANPHGMTKMGQLMNLYGRSKAPSGNPADIMRGQDFISAEEAEKERQDMEGILDTMPESTWGGFTPPSTAPAITATAANGSGPASTGAIAEGKDSGSAANGAAGSKRKLDEDEAAIKKEDKADDATGAGAGDNKSESVDEKANNSKEKEDKTGVQPAKKKVKLEDGSAKTTKASTPKKKKAAAKDSDKDDEKTKDTEPNASAPSNAPEDATKASANPKTTGGRTFNYVPTFYPPIPTMATGEDVASLLKTTVVDMLDAHTTAVKAPSTADVTTTTTYGLRSALVGLGTSYWGSQGDDDPSSEVGERDDSSKVPAGRGDAAPAPSRGPIEPLGRASGSRVSRILEGSMDAAVMQQ
jgi:Bromodomain associated